MSLCFQFLFDHGRMENIFSDLTYSSFSTEFTNILRPSVRSGGEFWSGPWWSICVSSLRTPHPTPSSSPPVLPHSSGGVLCEGGLPLGLQTAGGVLPPGPAQHPPLLLLQTLWLHRGGAPAPAALHQHHLLHQDQPGPEQN